MPQTDKPVADPVLLAIIAEAQAWQNSSSVRELRQTLRNILDLAHGRPVGSGG